MAERQAISSTHQPTRAQQQRERIGRNPLPYIKETIDWLRNYGNNNTSNADIDTSTVPKPRPWLADDPEDAIDGEE